MREPWEALLGRFALAPPGLAEARDLQRRFESKFVMPASGAAALLPALARDYALLPAGRAALATYHTLYFDTADLEFFHAHRRGRRIRHKVRIRHYPERVVSFLEVKTRLGESRSIKARRGRAYGDDRLDTDDLVFVQARVGRRSLLPQAWSDFRRVTLLGIGPEERVTIDLDLRVRTATRAASLGDLAVVEVKQSRLDRGSAAWDALRRAGWREGWASKYCTGIALTRPEVNAARLLPDVRALQGVSACAS